MLKIYFELRGWVGVWGGGGGGWVFIEMTSARDDVAKISKYSRSAKDNLLD